MMLRVLAALRRKSVERDKEFIDVLGCDDRRDWSVPASCGRCKGAATSIADRRCTNHWRYFSRFSRPFTPLEGKLRKRDVAQIMSKRIGA